MIHKPLPIFQNKNEIEVIPMGSFLTVDENGYLISKSSAKKIKEPWKTALDEMTAVSIKNLGADNVDSILVRGSVSRGEPVEGISDIDTIVLLKDKSKADISWKDSADKELLKKYPFATGFEFSLYETQKALKPKSMNMRFTLKAQAATIYGSDILPQLPNFKPDIELMKSLTGGFGSDLEQGKEYINTATNDEEMLSACRWISKRFLRNGFYTVMPRAQTFTRDLYPAYTKFSEYYPKKEKDMYAALYLAINPTLNKEALLKYVEDFGGWIKDEIRTL